MIGPTIFLLAIDIPDFENPTFGIHPQKSRKGSFIAGLI